ncbi:dephospho-CoA kinase [Peptostreptococcaceae bacterium AS15]|nr:dephospho-CoA kinase [Peptostreptococcaceae bacterium AS15]
MFIKFIPKTIRQIEINNIDKYSKDNMKIVGITGLIASGKSTLSSYLKTFGYKIVDADTISRDITKKDKIGYEKVVEKFGKDILSSNGEIDRAKLSNIVFNDKNALKKLNDTLHPLIFQEIDRQLDSYKVEKIVFLDAPLLFETKLNEKCDEVILVVCDEEVQISRIQLRDNKDYDSAKKVIDSQIGKKFKIENSDYIIDNNCDIERFYLKADLIMRILTN